MRRGNVNLTDGINLGLLISSSVLALMAIISLIYTVTNQKLKKSIILEDAKYRAKSNKDQKERDKIQYWIKKIEFKLSEISRLKSELYDLKSEEMTVRSNTHFTNARQLSAHSDKYTSRIYLINQEIEKIKRQRNSYIKKINEYFEK